MTKTRLYFVIILFVVVNGSLSDRNVCLQCDHVPIPQDCATVATCGDREDCYAERFRAQNGIEYYTVGCRKIDQCAGFVGRRRHIIPERSPVVKPRSIQDTSICHACCHSGNICNVDKLCGAPKLNKLNGMVCYQCNYRENPSDCNQITLCRSDEVCVVKQKKTELSHRTLYESGCEKRNTCAGSHASECCEGDLCNNKFNVKCTVKLPHAPKMSKPYIKDGDIQFDCSFAFHGGDTTFEVTWTVDGSPLLDFAGYPVVSHLHSGERSATLDADKLAGHLNKMLRCKVVPGCATGPNTDGGLQSNGYWVGMKVTPMRVHHNLITVVTIQSTLPFLCPDGTENNCSPEMVLHDSSNKTSSCTYKFKRNNATGSYGTGVVVHLKPHATLTLQNKLIFNQLKNVFFPGWTPYNVPVVQIGKFRSKEEYKMCKIQGKDITTFASRVFHTEKDGLIVLYKKDSPTGGTIEVQAKRINKGNDTYSCAIVVREGNSAVQIDVCDQTQIVPIIKYLSPSSQKEIFIDQSEDGLQLKIHLFTGSTIDVNVTGQDLHIGMSMLKRDVGSPGGICGNSTWMHIPDGVHSTQTSLNQTESSYLQLWTHGDMKIFYEIYDFSTDHKSKMAATADLRLTLNKIVKHVDC